MHRLAAIFAVVTTGSGLVGLCSNVQLAAPTANEVDAECSEIIRGLYDPEPARFLDIGSAAIN
jgi:hypothetical protein